MRNKGVDAHVKVHKPHKSPKFKRHNIDFLLPSGGSKALGPVGWNPFIAQSIICLFSISTDFEVSVSSLSGQAMKALPARLLAAYENKHWKYLWLKFISNLDTEVIMSQQKSSATYNPKKGS